MAGDVLRAHQQMVFIWAILKNKNVLRKNRLNPREVSKLFFSLFPFVVKIMAASHGTQLALPSSWTM